MAVEAASIIPIFIFGETKRLDFLRNQAFHNASGGDKRDRTADFLNVIQALSPYKSKTSTQKGEYGEVMSIRRNSTNPKEKSPYIFRMNEL